MSEWEETVEMCKDKFKSDYVARNCVSIIADHYQKHARPGPGHTAAEMLFDRIAESDGDDVRRLARMFAPARKGE